jgi:hypothetical protein
MVFTTLSSTGRKVCLQQNIYNHPAASTVTRRHRLDFCERRALTPGR